MDQHWQKLRTIVSLTSDWVQLFCEEWRKPTGEICEYWRVEKEDSLIVVPIYESQFLLPAADYRPGVGRRTLDLPGGRISDTEKSDIAAAAKRILQRELKLGSACVSNIRVIDATGTIVNSSFNNQKLLLASAELVSIDGAASDVRFHPVNDLATLLREIECLQCAYALLRFSQTTLR